MFTAPLPSVVATLRGLRTVTTTGALAGVLVASTLSSQPPVSPEGSLVLDPGPIAPEVRELPVPAGAAELPVAARTVGPENDAHGDDAHEHDAHGDGGQTVEAGRAVAALSVPRTREFSMLGVTWADPRAGKDVVVEVRTRGDHGWSEWEQLHIEASAAPNDADGVRGGTEPLWVGPARGAQVRVGGTRPRDLELSLIDPGEGPDVALQSSARPGIITRRQWGADESLTERCSNGRYGRTTEAVTIHHTVNSNNYEKWESDNLVRGILAYHTQSNGWCDLGYNFLVDKYGQIFQGRRGWMQRQVWGAHAGDNWVNEQSTGIALIGNFEQTAPRWAMKRATIDLAAWRLDDFYRNPQGRANIVGDTYPVVMGHRDVKATACPGRYAYAWLPAMREAVADKVNARTTAIQRRWRNEGGQGGWLGWPTVGEYGIAGGRRTSFRSGDLFWHRDHGVHEVHGRIRAKYLRKGGPRRSGLGFPTSDQVDGRRPGLVLNHFERGTIYHHPDTGVHVTYGPIEDKYENLGGVTSSFGMLTSDVRHNAGGDPDGQLQNMQVGRLYHQPRAGTHVTHGPIAGAYYRTGGARGLHGFPRSDVRAGAGGLADGLYQNFQVGRFYHHPDTGAHAVHGPIAGAFYRRGAIGGLHGFPTSDIWSSSGGLVQAFQVGRLYHHDAAGTHSVHGPIAGAYYRRGATRSVHGFPTTEVQSNVGGDPEGLVQRFQRGWFFHHPSTGAHEVHGPIAGAYLRHKAAGGRLGFPTTNVRATTYGLRSDFQGGHITWHRDTRKTTVTYR